MFQGSDGVRERKLTNLMAVRLSLRDGAEVAVRWATGQTITYTLLGFEEDEQNLVGMRLTREHFGAEHISADQFRKGEVVVVYRG
jgi:hypothetical protein